MVIVCRYRVKNLTGELNRRARAVNFVWNYCNDVQRQALKWDRQWPSGFDLNKLTSGSCYELDLGSTTIKAVCERYAKSRGRRCRPYLRWRGRKSLGWVPFKAAAIKREGTAFRFAGLTFRVFDARPLPEGKIKDGGSFSCDARGRWFLNIPVEISVAEPRATNRTVGIDLGLKSFAALSTGETVPNPRHTANMERQLAVAQRARHKRGAGNVHARITNARRDFLHKLSRRIVRDFDSVYIGNVNAAKLIQTPMAKSISDASWTTFRKMLAYKALRHGARYVEVDERFTSQVCSACGTLPASRPKGIADLGIREWTCSDCGTVHDRDVNAARNILRLGHQAPAEGIAVSH